MKGRYTDLNRWKHHLSHLETKSIPELSQLDIERIKQNMAYRELRPATVDHALKLLRRIVNHGVKYNICPALASKIDFPKINSTVTEFLTPEQASRLIDVLNSWKRQDIARMVKLAWLTGMRRGELFNLKIEDLNFSHALIKIVTPKGGTDTTIPMSPPARELQKKQLSFLEEEQKRRKNRYKKTTKPAPPWEDYGYLFPGTHGKKRKDCSAINRIEEKAQLPKAFRPFHGLRHHLAVTLTCSGEYTLDMIGELLTHKDSAVTRRYAAFLPEAAQKAATRAAEILTDHSKPNKRPTGKILSLT